MKASRMTQRVEHEVKIHYQLKHPSILEVCFFILNSIKLKKFISTNLILFF